MIIPHVNDWYVAVAVAPIAGVFAIREIWSRLQLQIDLRAREERAVAARREAMRAMQQALVAAEAAEKSREEFLARMNHELRTPLNAVIGFSRVLESNRAGNQRPEDIQLLSRVRAGGEKLLGMIEDVLDQSRIAHGQLPLALDDTDVVKVAARVVASYRSAAVAKGLRILAVLPDSAPTIPLDAGRFEQVLQHLVDNAVKFTISGTVRVSLATDAGTGRPSRLVVADSGIGIPKSHLGRIFEPFEQVDASERRTYGGAGLGLPLARQLCEGMACRLTVESEAGRGSRFSIRFPAPELGS
jgi:signal transduction histidine kinase